MHHVLLLIFIRFLRIFDTDMVVVIRKSSSREQITKALDKLKRRKGFNASKYCGVLKLDDDPVAIQKALRDEWD